MALSPLSITSALDLCDPMKLLLLNSFTNVKLFFLLLLWYVPKAPFWQMEILVHLAKAKGFILKYIP